MNTRADRVAGLLNTIHEWVVDCASESRTGYEDLVTVSSDVGRLVITARDAIGWELIEVVIEDSSRYGEKKMRLEVSWPSAGSPRPSVESFYRFHRAVGLIRSTVGRFHPMVEELNAWEEASEINRELDEADEIRITGGDREIHGEGCELCGEPMEEDEMAEMGKPNSAIEALPTYVCHAQCGLDRGMVAA